MKSLGTFGFFRKVRYNLDESIFLELNELFPYMRVNPITLVKPDVDIPFEIVPHTQYFWFYLYFPVRKAKRIFEIFFTKTFGKDLNDFKNMN